MKRWLWSAGLLLLGCGAPVLGDAGWPEDGGIVDAGPSEDAGSLVDAGRPGDAGAADDAGLPVDAGTAAHPDGGTLTACPPLIVAPAGCFTFTPADTGADPAGSNATEPHFALEPVVAAAQGRLLLFLNASLSHPRLQIASPTQNFYDAAATAGLHVLALSYSSQQVIGALCNTDACFADTRRSILEGVAAPDAAATVRDITEDEGVLWRLDAALRLLATERPTEGWDQFIRAGASPRERIAWDRVTAAGHSQGGGHAAYLGKTVALDRVIQLSSTCDEVGGAPAAWTADGVWATAPGTRSVGFGTASDGICPLHAAIWAAMGLDPSRRFDDAAVCDGSGAHGGSIGCADNAARWPTLF